jgi:Bacterial SH3 domain
MRSKTQRVLCEMLLDLAPDFKNGRGIRTSWNQVRRRLTHFWVFQCSRISDHSQKEKVMNIPKLMAGVAFICEVAVAGCLSAAEAQVNTNGPDTGANERPAASASVKPVKRKFLLSKPTAVYSEPNTSSAVVEHVRGGIHVHVTGITGDWLQLKLHNGKTGYIPAKAAE